jgi:hypothetical protein
VNAHGIGNFTMHQRQGRLAPGEGSLRGLCSQEAIDAANLGPGSGSPCFNYNGNLPLHASGRCFSPAELQPAWLATAHLYPGLYIPELPSHVQISDLVPGVLLWDFLPRPTVVDAFEVAKRRVVELLCASESGYIQPLPWFHALVCQRAGLLGTAASRAFYERSISFIPFVALPDVLQLVGNVELPAAAEIASGGADSGIPLGVFGASSHLTSTAAERQRLLEELAVLEVQLLALTRLSVLSSDVTADEKQGSFNATRSRLLRVDRVVWLEHLRSKASAAASRSQEGSESLLPAAMPIMRPLLVLGSDAGLSAVLAAAQLLLGNGNVREWVFCLASAKASTPPCKTRGKKPSPRMKPDPGSRYNAWLTGALQRRVTALDHAEFSSIGFEAMPPPSGVDDVAFDAFIQSFDQHLRRVAESLQSYLGTTYVYLGDGFRSDLYRGKVDDGKLPPLVAIALLEATFMALFSTGKRPFPPRCASSPLAPSPPPPPFSHTRCVPCFLEFRYIRKQYPFFNNIKNARALIVNCRHVTLTGRTDPQIRVGKAVSAVHVGQEPHPPLFNPSAESCGGIDRGAFSGDRAPERELL